MLLPDSEGGGGGGGLIPRNHGQPCLWASSTGVRSVIIFQYVQFWIRLAAVSYRGKNVRTVVSPAVRSVNKSLDTRNCVQNETDYAICVIFVTCVYYKAIGTLLCALI